MDNNEPSRADLLAEVLIGVVVERMKKREIGQNTVSWRFLMVCFGCCSRRLPLVARRKQVERSASLYDPKAAVY